MKWLRRLLFEHQKPEADVRDITLEQSLMQLFQIRRDNHKMATDAILSVIQPALLAIDQHMVKIGDKQATETIVWEAVSYMETDVKFLLIVGNIARKVIEDSKQVSFNYPVRVTLALEQALERDPAKVLALLEEMQVKNTNVQKEAQRQWLQELTGEAAVAPQPDFEMDKLTPEQKKALAPSFQRKPS